MRPGLFNKLKPVRSGRSASSASAGVRQSFRYATNTPQLKAFVVFRSDPNAADMGKIRAKGLGVYAETRPHQRAVARCRAA